MSLAGKSIAEQIAAMNLVPLSLSCQMVGGSHAIPQNLKSDHKMTGLRHNDRVHKGTKLRHRGLTTVGVNGGKMENAKGNAVNKQATYSAKEKRGLAIKVLRSRGMHITEGNISGILSGALL